MMTSCPLKNGCLDNWTLTDDPSPVVFDNYVDYMIFFTQQRGVKPRTFRGTKVLTSDAHYWEVNLNKRGFFTRLVYVGVVGLGKPLTRDKKLVSRDGQEVDQKIERWGLSTELGDLYPKDQARVRGTYSHPFRMQTAIGVLLDRKQGTLSYYQDGEPLGVAFTIPNCQDYMLFPAVWDINDGTDMKLGRQLMSLNNLQERCRATIVEELTEKIDIDLLNLPIAIKDYLHEGYYDKQKSTNMISTNKFKICSTIIRVLLDSYIYVRDLIMLCAS